MKVSVIIPAYNEEEGIVNTLSELSPRIPSDWEVIVVDDGSSDNTYQRVCETSIDKVRCVQHYVNRGYGSAIKTGCREAAGDVIAWYDADGQHRPEDLLGVVKELEEKHYDYCIGVRDSRSFVDKNRRLGKKVLGFFANAMAKEKIPDVNSGLRAFKASIIRRYLSMLPPRFGASTVTTFIMQEIDAYGGTYPIVVKERVGKSTVKPVRDGFRTLSLIMQIILNFRPMQVFGTTGVVLILVGTIYGIYRAITQGLGIPALAVILILFGVQEIFFGFISRQISQVRRDVLEKEKD